MHGLSPPPPCFNQISCTITIANTEGDPKGVDSAVEPKSPSVDAVKDQECDIQTPEKAVEDAAVPPESEEDGAAKTAKNTYQVGGGGGGDIYMLFHVLMRWPR